MSTAECGGAHEGKGVEELTQTILRECREYKENKEGAGHIFWRSTDFTVQSVVSSCSTGVQNQTQRPENEYNMSFLNDTKAVLCLFTTHYYWQLPKRPNLLRTFYDFADFFLFIIPFCGNFSKSNDCSAFMSSKSKMICSFVRL